MSKRSELAKKIVAFASRWLLQNSVPKHRHLCDFPQICEKVQPGDVLLVEGRSRVSQVIQLMTQSPWSHAMLYIGSLDNIISPEARAILQNYPIVQEGTPLLIESELGSGTIISPLNKYQQDHIRILRPEGISAADTQKVIAYAVSRIGAHYDIRHILDLGRFLLPWHLVPQEWRLHWLDDRRSKPMEEICSSMIAEAFQSIGFPILPMMQEDFSQKIELIEANARFFTPSDFDFSPYFSVIKYPIFPVDQPEYYHHLPWKSKESDPLPPFLD